MWFQPCVKCVLSTGSWLESVFARGWAGSDLLLNCGLLFSSVISSKKIIGAGVLCAVACSSTQGRMWMWSRIRLSAELFMSLELSPDESWREPTGRHTVRRFLFTKVILLLEKQSCLRNLVLTAFFCPFEQMRVRHIGHSFFNRKNRSS